MSAQSLRYGRGIPKTTTGSLVQLIASLTLPTIRSAISVVYLAKMQKSAPYPYSAAYAFDAVTDLRKRDDVEKKFNRRAAVREESRVLFDHPGRTTLIGSNRTE